MRFCVANGVTLDIDHMLKKIRYKKICDGDGACKMVNYCSATCQQRHRPQHKNMKRVAEMQEEEQLFEKISEEAIFKQPPLCEDCPICMLPMPALVPYG